MNYKGKACPSAAAAAALDDDVCMEILLRLPAKSVIRFKSVSKRWLSLISAAHFQRLHTLRRHKPHPSFLLRLHLHHNSHSSFFYFNDPVTDTRKPTKMIPFTIPLLNNPETHIVSSCNGLLLVKRPKADYFFYNPSTADYFVYNPSTELSRKLNINDNKILAISLAFDPLKSPHYRVVCVRTHRVEVYDSESATWKNSCTDFRAPPSIVLSSGVHCNNCIYWLTASSGSSFFNDGDIYSFDIDKDCTRSFRRPRLLFPPLPFSVHNSLKESDGCLLYFVVYEYRNSYTIEMWELKGGDGDQEPEWVSKFYEKIPGWEPIGFIVGGGSRVVGKKMNASFLTRLGQEIGVYSFMDERWTELVHLSSLYPSSSFMDCSFPRLRLQVSVYQFGETLALV